VAADRVREFVHYDPAGDERLRVLSVTDAAWHVDRLRGDAPPGVFSNDAWHAALDAVVERLDLGEGN